MVRIDMLDVGDGTSILLRSGRESILYDCGSRWLGIGERELPRAIRALGSGRVETVIVSHADIDHFSGLVDAARPLGVRRVIVTGHLVKQANAQPDGAARLLIDRLRELRIRVETVKRGDTLALASLDLEVLHPAPEDAFEGDNDASIVLRLRAGPNRLRRLCCFSATSNAMPCNCSSSVSRVCERTSSRFPTTVALARSPTRLSNGSTRRSCCNRPGRAACSTTAGTISEPVGNGGPPQPTARSRSSSSGTGP
ncbi:MAG: ComEC/Rec2 family competence protein [Phycisphaerales bacterium]